MARRILQIIPSLDRAGAEKQLCLLVEDLGRQAHNDGYDVHVCALTRGGPLAARLEASGAPPTVIGKRWKIDPAAFWRLRRHIAYLAPDLVQTWLFAGNSYGRVAAWQAGVRHTIASERCVDQWKSWHELAIDRRLARRTSRIVANSEAVRDFYVARGLPAERMVVIPNGVEIPTVWRQTVDAQDRASLLAELKLPPDARLIGAVGRLWPQKRVQDLIWATDILKVIRGDVHLLVVGDGPQRERLERYRRDVDIADRVHLLGHRDDVPRLMAHFDLLWLASGYEGMPNSVLEAMACGVPVVATDVPGTREVVVGGETGYLVPLGDRAALARRANQLLDDEALARRLGAAGRARAETHFGVEAMTRRYLDLYGELLG